MAPLPPPLVTHPHFKSLVAGVNDAQTMYYDYLAIPLRAAASYAFVKKTTPGEKKNFTNMMMTTTKSIPTQSSIKWNNNNNHHHHHHNDEKAKEEEEENKEEEEEEERLVMPNLDKFELDLERVDRVYYLYRYDHSFGQDFEFIGRVDMKRRGKMNEMERDEKKKKKDKDQDVGDDNKKDKEEEGEEEGKNQHQPPPPSLSPPPNPSLSLSPPPLPLYVQLIGSCDYAGFDWQGGGIIFVSQDAKLFMKVVLAHRNYMQKEIVTRIRQSLAEDDEDMQRLEDDDDDELIDAYNPYTRKFRPLSVPTLKYLCHLCIYENREKRLILLLPTTMKTTSRKMTLQQLCQKTLPKIIWQSVEDFIRFHEAQAAYYNNDDDNVADKENDDDDDGQRL